MNCIDCKKSIVSANQRCEECANRRKFKRKKQRDEWRSKNLCTNCGSVKEDDDSYCNKCKVNRKITLKKQKNKWIENNLCYHCGSSKENPDKSHCNKCSERKNVDRKGLYYSRKNSGLCVRCGVPSNNTTKCDDCNKVEKAYKKAKRKEWKKLGLCTSCGGLRTNPKKLVCDPCSQRARKKNLNLKKRIMDAYGGICTCCQDDYIGRLTIDHIENNGAEHRRQLGIGGGRAFYHFLVKNNFPPDYQVLCSSCNLSKHIMGECPH